MRVLIDGLYFSYHLVNRTDFFVMQIRYKNIADAKLIKYTL